MNSTTGALVDSNGMVAKETVAICSFSPTDLSSFPRLVVCLMLLAIIIMILLLTLCKLLNGKRRLSLYNARRLIPHIQVSDDERGQDREDPDAV